MRSSSYRSDEQTKELLKETPIFKLLEICHEFQYAILEPADCIKSIHKDVLKKRFPNLSHPQLDSLENDLDQENKKLSKSIDQNKLDRVLSECKRML